MYKRQATSTEEIGNPVYPPARRKLAEHGISCEGKTARQMTRRDYETYDYLIAMDHNNLRNMARFVGGDPEHKVSPVSYTHLVMDDLIIVPDELNTLEHSQTPLHQVCSRCV